MDDFVEQLKALGDETRVKILRLLSDAKVDLCVCEIMDAIEDSHCNISRHLKILKTAKLVRDGKQGKWVYFGLAAPKDQFHESVLNAVSSIPDEHFFNDSKRLKLRLSLRENEKCVDGLKSEKWARALELLATLVPEPDDTNKKREKIHYEEK
jgi:ArsR family transcriptional regulator